MAARPFCDCLASVALNVVLVYHRDMDHPFDIENSRPPQTVGEQLAAFVKAIANSGCDVETACVVSNLPFGLAVDNIENAKEGDTLYRFKEAARRAVAYRNARLQDVLFVTAVQGSHRETIIDDPERGRIVKIERTKTDASVAMKLLQQYKPRQYNQAKVEVASEDGTPDVSAIDFIEHKRESDEQD